MAKDVAKLIQETGVKLILNDLRNAKPTEKTFDVYNMPQTAQKAGVNQFIKRAIVVGDIGKEFHFFETVFVNQGHQVRMFAEIEDAKNGCVKIRLQFQRCRARSSASTSASVKFFAASKTRV